MDNQTGTARAFAKTNKAASGSMNHHPAIIGQTVGTAKRTPITVRQASRRLPQDCEGSIA